MIHGPFGVRRQVSKPDESQGDAGVVFPCQARQEVVPDPGTGASQIRIAGIFPVRLTQRA